MSHMESSETVHSPFERGHESLPTPVNPDTWPTTGPSFFDILTRGLTRLLSDEEQGQFQYAFVQSRLSQEYDFVSDRLRYRLIRQLVINPPLRESCLALQHAEHWWTQILTHVSLYSAWPYLPNTIRARLTTCLAQHDGGRPLLLLHDPTLPIQTKHLPEYVLAGIGLQQLPAQRRNDWFQTHLRANRAISYASLIVLAQLPAEEINALPSTSPAILVNPWLNPRPQKPLFQKLTRSADPDSYFGNITGRFPIFSTLDLRRSSLAWCTSSDALKLWSLFASFPLDQVLHCLMPSEQDFDRAVLDHQLSPLRPHYDYIAIRAWIRQAHAPTRSTSAQTEC